MELGYWLSCEEYGPTELVEQAQQAEDAGWDHLAISDHYLPWNDEQGHSPFVWSVIAAIAGATDDVHVTTAVTCPTIRIHPAIIAQAAATSAVLLDGRFALGVGSGENLNEHILGDRWPDVDERLDMLGEAIEVMRELWTGQQISWDGGHYRVVNARLYDLPEDTIPVYMSAFGEKAVGLAAEAADGYLSSSPMGELLERYHEQGGTGPAVGGLKACLRDDVAEARALAHRLWPNEKLPGQLAQELPTVAHIEQATSLVTEDAVASSVPCGPDPAVHAEALREFVDAGFDRCYVQPIGGNIAETIRFYRDEVAPLLDGGAPSEER